MDANSRSIVRERQRTRRRAFCLVVLAVLLEVTLLMPFVDHLADSNNTIHFTPARLHLRRRSAAGHGVA